MNPYLTDKHRKSRKWVTPVVVILLIFALGAGTAAYEMFFEVHNYKTGVGEIVLLGLCLYVVFRILRTSSHIEDARTLAVWLDDIKSKTISIEKFNKMTHRDESFKKLEMCLKEGLLRNVEINYPKQMLILHGKEQLLVENQAIEMKCDNCGADAVVELDRVTYCEYCGQPMIAKLEGETNESYIGRLNQFIENTEKELMMEKEEDERENYYNQ